MSKIIIFHKKKKEEGAETGLNAVCHHFIEYFNSVGGQVEGIYYWKQLLQRNPL